MNHYADIEEGVEVFDDEQERTHAEAAYKRSPHLVTFKHRGHAYTAMEVYDVHLLGSRRAGSLPFGFCTAPHPFDFEEGYAKVLVAVPRERDILGVLREVLELRWTDYDKVHFTEIELVHPR